MRAFGMRRSRSIGLAKTHLQHLGIAAAINVVRVVAWLDGEELAPTRVSAFQKLYLAAYRSFPTVSNRSGNRIYGLSDR